MELLQVVGGSRGITLVLNNKLTKCDTCYEFDNYCVLEDLEKGAKADMYLFKLINSIAMEDKATGAFMCTFFTDLVNKRHSSTDTYYNIFNISFRINSRLSLYVSKVLYKRYNVKK